MIARQSGRPQFTHPWALSDQRSRQLPMSLPGRCHPICPITAEPRFHFQTPPHLLHYRSKTTPASVSTTQNHSSPPRSTTAQSRQSKIRVQFSCNPKIYAQSKNRWAGVYRTRAGRLIRKVRPGADGDEFGVEHEGVVVECKDDCSIYINLKRPAVVDQPG